MKFKTIIFQKGNNLGIEVPANVIEALGAGKKPPVVITIKNYVYRSTVGVMGGKYLIPLSSEHRKHVQVSGGETLEAAISLDTEPRIVELPKILKDKLKSNKSASAFFATLAPGSQKKIVAQIESAKTEETLKKRLEKIISDLNQKVKP